MSGTNYNYLANPAVAAPNFYLNSLQGLQAYRDQQAQLATSQAYQQSINPQTGALDQGKFNALLASTPQGAWNIGPAMQQAGQAQTAQGQGQQQQTQAKMLQMQGISAYMTPLIQKVQAGQPVSGQEVLGAAQSAADAGFVTPEMQANVQKQVASLGPNGDASNIVRGAFFTTNASLQQLQAASPNLQPTNFGGYTGFPNLRPGTPGYIGSGAVVPNTMSPGDAAQTVDIQLGNNQTIQVPKGIAVGILANNPNLQRLNPGFGGGGQGGGPVTNQSFGPNQGRYTPPASGGGGPATGGGTQPPTGPYVIGDSIGQGIRTAGKFDGNTTVGASPQAVLAAINDPKNPPPVQGRDVVLANGSNPGNLAMIPDQIAALQKQGAKSITVVGVANPQVDQQIQAYAKAAGVRYVPLGAAGPDGVHPTDYGGLATAVGAPAQGGPPSWARPPPPLAQGGSAGGLGVTAAPGYVASQAATAQASTQAANTLQAQVSASKDIEPILADMQTQLGTKGFSTGVGSIMMNSTRQLMQRIGLVPEEPAPGVDLTSPQAAQELFAKDAARLQAAQLGALGNPTDARQELSETTNPGLMLSKYGNLGILRMLEGNQQAIRIQGDAWATAQQQGWTPDRFNEWLNNHFLATDPKTGGRFDPRVQWFAYEPSLQEQRAYFAKIPKAQQEQFLANLQYAKNLGWIGQSSTGLTMPGGP
jgi:hypothetical protein